MRDKILELINENTSPLFRIMSIHNDDEINRKAFDNNISAFHIGNGFILSVAHNLRPEAQLFKSMQEAKFQNDIIANCTANEQLLMNKCFVLDAQTNKRYINISDQQDVQLVIDALKRINFDTRWVTLYSEGICKPFMIINFRNNQFYNDATLTQLFSQSHFFHEPTVNTYTFLVELELVHAYYSEDIVLYRIVNTNQQIIDKLPIADLSFDLSLINTSLYCIQGSPSGTNLGRMMNESRIEGILDHHAIEGDRIGGPVFREGIRYLLKGYFRFGSSGAPYFIYDEETESFKVNAIQSEASPIQLSIGGNRNGNFQYINAIASPLLIIKEDLEARISYGN
tara:strand:+ start:1856 stop:2875 length:1020 start_codon:yes stop_codon:yes gene_type:complete